MKINSNIVDYYDGVAGQFGPSTDVIFNRLNSVEFSNRFDFVKEYRARNGLLEFGIVGFCGKLYRFCWSHVPDSIKGELKARFVDNKSDSEFLMNIYHELNKLSYSDRYRHHLKHYYDLGEAICYHYGAIKAKPWWISNGHSEGSLATTENHKIFQDLGTPIFVVYSGRVVLTPYVDLNNPPRIVGAKMRSNETNMKAYSDTEVLIKNPILKELDFSKIVDPYTATQEIEMYLGRLATNNTPPMPVGSDKVIAASKGFDEWSFRKLPTKKRK